MKTGILLLLFSFSLQTQLVAQRTIKGVVTDEEGAALTGALVKVIGATAWATTDQNGQFSCQTTDIPSIQLLVSYLGYKNKTVQVGSESSISIALDPDPKELSEVVILGFGTQTRKRVTSSIGSVGEEEFKVLPAPNFEAVLQGKVPGVVFTQTTGALASTVAIRVRGVSSVNASNQPLIVVDGLIVQGLWGNPLGNTTTNPLINLNPNDIESVEVLKDGAASAIFGSRGGNGVILITTKRGKLNTSPIVRLHYHAGYAEPSDRYDLMNGQEYATYWNQSVRNIGLDEKSGLIYDVEKQPSTDWLDLITRKAFFQEIGAAVSGGSSATKYYFSGTFRQQDDYYITKGLKRYSFRANIDQLISSKVTAGLSLNPSQTVHDRIFEGLSQHAPNAIAASMPPTMTPYDENGRIRRGILTDDINYTAIPGSPLVNLLETNDQLTTTQLLLNAYAEYAPFTQLIFRTELGSELTQTEELNKVSSGTQLGYPNGRGYAINQQLSSYNWTLLGIYTFSKPAGHTIDLTAGMNLIKGSVTGTSITKSNFPDDRLLYLKAAATIDAAGGSKTDYSFLGYFARMNYAFQSKYLLTLSARYDGSSRFGAKNRFGFFPALSAGWVLSEEPFFKNLPVNYLKIRGSMGVSGNAEISNFSGQSLLSFGVYADNPGSILSTLENDQLKWEKTHQINWGLDFGIWNNRISGSVEYFIKDTRDLLLNVPLPGTTGITLTLQNAGAVRNQGVEFLLNADIFNRGLKWTFSINGATLNNKILKLVDQNRDGLEEDIITGIYILRKGEPLNAFFLTPYAGVDPKNGDALFLDKEGNKVPINPPASGRVVAGTGIPKFTAGITNQFEWKGFDLSFLLYFSAGNKLYRSDGTWLESMTTGISNQLRSQLAAWTLENPNTNIPQARLGKANGGQSSTRFLDDADFMRLRNVQLGYSFSQLGKRNGALRVYVTGQNLWMITDFEGLEPEASFGNPNSLFSGGVAYPSPQPRSLLLGINYEF